MHGVFDAAINHLTAQISSAIIADRIDAKAGNSWLLLVLIALGVAHPVHGVAC